MCAARNHRDVRAPGSNESDVDPQTVIAALEDDTCRDVLEATADEALTATELSERCDVPLSTMYRKLEVLTEASLVLETLRLRRDGRHASEYRQCFDDVKISMCEGGTVEVAVSQSGFAPRC